MIKIHPLDLELANSVRVNDLCHRKNGVALNITQADMERILPEERIHFKGLDVIGVYVGKDIAGKPKFQTYGRVEYNRFR